MVNGLSPCPKDLDDAMDAVLQIPEVHAFCLMAKIVDDPTVAKEVWMWRFGFDEW